MNLLLPCVVVVASVLHAAYSANIVGYAPVGCYKDRGARAIPTLEGKDKVLDLNYAKRDDPITKCYLAARKRGYKMFAVQNGGWCAASKNAPKRYNKYGKSKKCLGDGEGGPWANAVYRIVPKCKKIKNYKGWCQLANGRYPPKGIIKLNGDDNRSKASWKKCLNLCKKYGGIIGCEAVWGLWNQGCYAYTMHVKRGSGKGSNNRCFVIDEKCNGRPVGLMSSIKECKSVTSGKGWCEGLDGKYPPMGVYKLNGDDGDNKKAQEKCLKQCHGFKGVLGCEVVWNQWNRGCYAYTVPISGGSGKGNNICYKFQHCRKPECGHKVGCFSAKKRGKLLVYWRYNILWHQIERFADRLRCACQKAAAEAGVKYFGVHFWGECWALEKKDIKEVSTGDCKAPTKTFAKFTSCKTHGPSCLAVTNYYVYETISN